MEANCTEEEDKASVVDSAGDEMLITWRVA